MKPNKKKKKRRKSQEEGDDETAMEGRPQLRTLVFGSLGLVQFFCLLRFG